MTASWPQDKLAFYLGLFEFRPSMTTCVAKRTTRVYKVYLSLWHLENALIYYE